MRGRRCTSRLYKDLVIHQLGQPSEYPSENVLRPAGAWAPHPSVAQPCLRKSSVGSLSNPMCTPPGRHPGYHEKNRDTSHDLFVWSDIERFTLVDDCPEIRSVTPNSGNSLRAWSHGISQPEFSFGPPLASFIPTNHIHRTHFLHTEWFGFQSSWHFGWASSTDVVINASGLTLNRTIFMCFVGDLLNRMKGKWRKQPIARAWWADQT